LLAKLTKDQAREVLRRATAGEPLREIALGYAVDRSTISRLMRGTLLIYREGGGYQSLGAKRTANARRHIREGRIGES
jgi:hypothetical protein